MKNLQNKHIVITRPVDQAQKLSNAIKQAGGTPWQFPLIAIAPLDDYTLFERKIEHLQECDWLIFISSNAVHNAMPLIVARYPVLPKNLKFAAIGPTTDGQLQSFGISKTLTPDLRFDSESLLALPEMQDVQGKKVMIVRGIGGRELMADTLKERGAEVEFAECYHRVNPQHDASFLDNLWENIQLDAIVVTSSEAMRNLLEMTLNQYDWLKQITLCVNHARIAELPTKHGLKVNIAAAPGDDAMLDCLRTALSQP
jgi:uroporphyrinogen-III synthase